MVARVGIEPTLSLQERDFESRASASSATAPSVGRHSTLYYNIRDTKAMNPQQPEPGQPTPTPPQLYDSTNNEQAVELARAKLNQIFQNTSQSNAPVATSSQQIQTPFQPPQQSPTQPSALEPQPTTSPINNSPSYLNTAPTPTAPVVTPVDTQPTTIPTFTTAPNSIEVTPPATAESLPIPQIIPPSVVQPTYSTDRQIQPQISTMPEQISSAPAPQSTESTGQFQIPTEAPNLSSAAEATIKSPESIQPTMDATVQNEEPSLPSVAESQTVNTQSAIEKNPSRRKPVLKAVVITAVALVVVNSQVIFGQVAFYTSPGSQVITPTIVETDSSTVVGSESKIVIPKINVEVPVVYDVTTFDEREVQAGLKRGVVHYGSTAVPGEVGNNVIVGHSSNNFWDNGKYKYAFVLLSKLEEGDTFSLHYKSKRYIYEVFEKKIVEPDDTSVLARSDEPIVTLITCDPPGTSWKRLIVKARQISPDPHEAKKPEIGPNAGGDSLLPGNNPSFFDSIKRFLGID